MPISIERLNGEFLLHYSDFSFFVNRNGWRARPDWLINWEGRPQTFALSHPYLLAFEPNFIEIRHLESSALVHIITAKNIRMLHSSTSEVSFRRRQSSIAVQLIVTVDRSYTPTKKKMAKTLWRAWTSGTSRLSSEEWLPSTKSYHPCRLPNLSVLREPPQLLAHSSKISPYVHQSLRYHSPYVVHQNHWLAAIDGVHVGGHPVVCRANGSDVKIMTGRLGLRCSVVSIYFEISSILGGTLEC